MIQAQYPECYACSNPPVSVEHCPPESFFPTKKDDKGGYIYKKHLITVPSCERHNSGKSIHDRYALFHIAMSNKVNHVGVLHQDKFIQLMKNPKSKDIAFKKMLDKEIFARNEKGQPVAKMDAIRMVYFFNLLARGLYFYSQTEKHTKRFKIVSEPVSYNDKDYYDEQMRAIQSLEEHIGDSPKIGSHPEVFHFSIKKNESGCVFIRMVFFGGYKVWAFYDPIYFGDEPPAGYLYIPEGFKNHNNFSA